MTTAGARFQNCDFVVSYNTVCSNQQYLTGFNLFYYVWGPADLDEDYEDGFLPMRLRDISVLYTNSIYAIT